MSVYRLCLLLVALGVVAAPASAQTERMRGPFSGLFGGGQRANNSQSLNLRASLFGVQQSVDLPSDFDLSLLDPRFQTSSGFAGVSSSLEYQFSRRGDTSNFTVGATGFVADYSLSPKDPQYGVNTSSGMGFSTKLTRKITLTSSALGGYGTQYSFAPFGGGVGGGLGAGALDPSSFNANPSSLTPGLGLAPLNLNFVDASGTVGVSAALTRRATLSAETRVLRTFFLGDSSSAIAGSQNDLATLSSNASFSYRIFRRLSFRAGYRREQSLLEIDGVRPEPIQGIDLALDYGDAITLQLSRRTTLALAVSAGSVRSLEGRTEYRLLGNANLTHTMGRTWSTGLGYARTLNFQSAFQQPVLLDTVNAFFGGQPAPRLSLTSGVNLTKGYVGLDTSQSFDAYSATAALNVALARRASAFLQYSYYDSRVSQGISNLPLLPTYRRSAVVAGVSFWAPLYNRPRVRQ